MAKKEVSYADAIAEIEAILDKLSKGNVDVDTLAADVKRAAELIELCRGRLRKAGSGVEQALNGSVETAAEE